MSIPAINAAWEVEGLSVAERLTLIALADYANKNGKAWPSLDKLGKRICGSDRHVRTQIRKLEARGLLTTKRRGRHSLMFTMNLELSERNNSSAQNPDSKRNNSSAQGDFKRNNSSGNKRNNGSGQSPSSGTIVPAEPSFNNHQKNLSPLPPNGGKKECVNGKRKRRNPTEPSDSYESLGPYFDEMVELQEKERENALCES